MTDVLNTPMSLNEYSKQAFEKGFYKGDQSLSVYVMGLCGESGEVAEKFKKMIRDNDGIIDDTFKQEVIKELSDVLWYVNALGQELGFSLEDIAQKNLAKIQSRKERGVQNGNGDNR